MTTCVLSSKAVSALQTLYPKTWTMFTAFRVGNMFHLEVEIPELGGIMLCCQAKSFEQLERFVKESSIVGLWEQICYLDFDEGMVYRKWV